MLPAYAGMILAADLGDVADGRAPRVCGDDPYGDISVETWDGCSPRMRG